MELKIKIKVLLFGMLADIAKNSYLDIESTNDTDSLKEIVLIIHPEFKNTNFIITVNKKVIANNMIITETDEIALLPPFAGG